MINAFFGSSEIEIWAQIIHIPNNIGYLFRFAAKTTISGGPDIFLKIPLFHIRKKGSSENGILQLFTKNFKVGLSPVKSVSYFDFSNVPFWYTYARFLKIYGVKVFQNRSSEIVFWINLIKSKCYDFERAKNLAAGVLTRGDLQKNMI